MNIRRYKLASWIAMQSAAAGPKDKHEIAELRAYPVREPASGRTYTVVRLRTQSGVTGWGEAGRVNGTDIEKAKSRVIGKPATAFAVTSTQTPLDAAIRTGNAPEVRGVLAGNPLAPDQVETAIDLLAWNEVAPDAIRALSAVAGDNTPVLLRHLLDQDEDFAVRRRLVNVLASSRTIEVFEGLLSALNDRRFEVRYRAGRALSAMEGEIPGLRVDRERVLDVVQREIAADVAAQVTTGRAEPLVAKGRHQFRP